MRRGALPALGALLAAAAAAQPAKHAGMHAGSAGVVALDLDARGSTIEVLTAATVVNGFELRHQRSRDGGRSWGASHRLPVAAAAIHGPHRGSDPQIAAFGDRLVAVWTGPGTSEWGSGPLATALSSDGGATWRLGSDPADDGSTGGHGYADLVADEDGVFYLVWLDGRDGAQGLRAAVSRDSGATWSANRTVEGRTCECCWNRLVSAHAGEAWVLYRGLKPRDMAVAATTDGGRTWHRRGAAGAFGWSFDGCPHVGGGVALADGALHALTWTGAEGRLGLYALSSRDGGRGWSAPVRLGTDRARHGDLAASKGRLAAVWDEPSDGKGVVFAAVSSNGGIAWSTPRRLSAEGFDASHPLIVSAGDGAFVAAWTEQAGLSPFRFESTRLEGN